MQWVYILYSNTKNRFYIGETDDLHRRLAQHNRGNVASTSAHGPWVLAWAYPKETRTEALKLEQKLKNLKSPKRLIAFMEKYNDWKVECSLVPIESSDDSEG